MCVHHDATRRSEILLCKREVMRTLKGDGLIAQVTDGSRREIA